MSCQRYRGTVLARWPRPAKSPSAWLARGSALQVLGAKGPFKGIYRDYKGIGFRVYTWRFMGSYTWAQTQRTQYPVIMEYSLNQIMKPLIM